MARLEQELNLERRRSIRLELELEGVRGKTITRQAA